MVAEIVVTRPQAPVPVFFSCFRQHAPFYFINREPALIEHHIPEIAKKIIQTKEIAVYVVGLAAEIDCGEWWRGTLPIEKWKVRLHLRLTERFSSFNRFSSDLMRAF